MSTNLGLDKRLAKIKEHLEETDAIPLVVITMRPADQKLAAIIQKPLTCRQLIETLENVVQELETLHADNHVCDHCPEVGLLEVNGKNMTEPEILTTISPDYPFTLRCPGCNTKHVIHEDTLYSFCSCFTLKGPVYQKTRGIRKEVK